MNLPDKCLLQARAVVCPLTLLTIRDEVSLHRYITRDLQWALAVELEKVGRRIERQIPEGLEVLLEVYAFTPSDFYRIVREEAQKLLDQQYTPRYCAKPQSPTPGYAGDPP